jgi:hypothetical protein
MKPIDIRQGRPNASVWCHRSDNASWINIPLRSCLPSSLPPRASAEKSRATPRTVPCPLKDAISAARYCLLLKSSSWSIKGSGIQHLPNKIRRSGGRHSYRLLSGSAEKTLSGFDSYALTDTSTTANHYSALVKSARREIAMNPTVHLGQVCATNSLAS